jgi:hypothetical protein
MLFEVTGNEYLPVPRYEILLFFVLFASNLIPVVWHRLNKNFTYTAQMFSV